MPKLNLTQAAVEKLPSPPATAVAYWDTNLAGFGVRVSPLFVAPTAFDRRQRRSY